MLGLQTVSKAVSRCCAWREGTGSKRIDLGLNTLRVPVGPAKKRPGPPSVRGRPSRGRERRERRIRTVFRGVRRPRGANGPGAFSAWAAGGDGR